VIAPRGELIGYVASVPVIVNHYDGERYDKLPGRSCGELFAKTPRYLTEW
jgi:hypothetical protein